MRTSRPGALICRKMVSVVSVVSPAGQMRCDMRPAIVSGGLAEPVSWSHHGHPPGPETTAETARDGVRSPGRRWRDPADLPVPWPETSETAETTSRRIPLPSVPGRPPVPTRAPSGAVA